jgi:hypothetical protein
MQPSRHFSPFDFIFLIGACTDCGHPHHCGGANSPARHFYRIEKGAVTCVTAPLSSL